eukprot:TRINITY_DN36020_c0_g1_i1.p2 TRINITY_DN36020_c0_g1~~TRINITY_DN36020_c0_g1_i1.p2  ORF type:complete len:129 (-),score=11.36 TRINITY_DN36020_c0_g1_i1:173-559(-)
MDLKTFINSVGTLEVVNSLKVRVAVVYGSESVIVGASTQECMRSTLGQHISLVSVPEAGHHCFLDQPLAVVATLRAVFAEWNRSETATGQGVFLPRLGFRSVQSCWDGDKSAMAERVRKDMAAFSSKL